jgi:hypothetical protein
MIQEVRVGFTYPPQAGLNAAFEKPNGVQHRSWKNLATCARTGRPHRTRPEGQQQKTPEKPGISFTS